jgi:ABC-type sugar transport system substrate-binding protein
MLLNACASDQKQNGGGAGDAAGPPRISLLNAYAQDEFWQGCSAGAKKAATELHVTRLTELDGNNSAQTQANQIDTTIQQKPDSLLIAALDSKAVVPALKNAAAKGIDVYAYNTAVPDAKLNATVAMDEVATGAAAAQQIVTLAKSSGKTSIKLVHLVGAIATEPVRLRRQGFNDEIAKPVAGLTVTMTEVVTDWKPEKAVSGLQDTLVKGPVDAIFTESDFLTPFLVPVLQRAGYTPRGGARPLIIGGLGGIPGGIKAIKDGWQSFTLNYPIDGMCDSSVRLAVAEHQGKSVADSWRAAATAAGLDRNAPKLVGSDQSGPSILLTANLVTPENVDDASLWANRLFGG